MSRNISCDGCGTVGRAGSVLPVGWFRLLVKTRRPDLFDARTVGKFDLCSPECAMTALQEHEEFRVGV